MNGIGRHHFAVQLLGQPHAEFRFSRARTSDDGEQHSVLQARIHFVRGIRTTADAAARRDDRRIFSPDGNGGGKRDAIAFRIRENLFPKHNITSKQTGRCYRVRPLSNCRGRPAAATVARSDKRDVRLVARAHHLRDRRPPTTTPHGAGGVDCLVSTPVRRTSDTVYRFTASPPSRRGRFPRNPPPNSFVFKSLRGRDFFFKLRVPRIETSFTFLFSFFFVPIHMGSTGLLFYVSTYFIVYNIM